MNDIASTIREAALQRIAIVLEISVSSLNGDIFLRDLYQPEFVSDFRRNGFDILLDDIRDVADKGTLAKISDGDKVVETVDDYIDHMTDCYTLNAEAVMQVLGGGS